MRRIEIHAALLNPADCPECGPLWVWHSYLKIKSRIQEVCSTKVLPLQSKRQTKIIYCQNFCFGDNLFKAVLKIKTLNAKDSQYIYFLARTGRQQGIESCSNISNMTWDFFNREVYLISLYKFSSWLLGQTSAFCEKNVFCTLKYLFLPTKPKWLVQMKVCIYEALKPGEVHPVPNYPLLPA